ncbi:hypothetical protein FHW69_003832 [Luteibacter sp. Sphag1AF]|uniref:hypothetical protein n=1 Tax=Luteibacter sp. Sphag1AF TaxID=2587031 RepID=UPI001609A4FB|nr:hypothetical protein [Luteibacter sp. Sphag1AF]MBB3229178.1 hypothetical protein [Luteibacter sp. Sphag1AF]
MSGEIGFFLGAAPGVAYTLWNMIRGQQTMNEAKRIAKAHGEFLDLHASPSLSFDYIYRPGKFIRPNDSDGMREAKALLLSTRKQLFRRHALGALFVGLGIFVGVFLSVGLSGA